MIWTEGPTTEERKKRAWVVVLSPAHANNEYPKRIVVSHGLTLENGALIFWDHASPNTFTDNSVVIAFAPGSWTTVNPGTDS